MLYPFFTSLFHKQEKWNTICNFWHYFTIMLHHFSVKTRIFAIMPFPVFSPPGIPLPSVPVQRQLWVRGGGLVWWLSRICCTSCSAEKPVLLFPLLQVHLMPWTAGREEETETSARQPHRPAGSASAPTTSPAPSTGTARERKPHAPWPHGVPSRLTSLFTVIKSSQLYSARLLTTPTAV